MGMAYGIVLSSGRSAAKILSEMRDRLSESERRHLELQVKRARENYESI